MTGSYQPPNGEQQRPYSGYYNDDQKQTPPYPLGGEGEVSPWQYHGVASYGLNNGPGDGELERNDAQEKYETQYPGDNTNTSENAAGFHSEEEATTAFHRSWHTLLVLQDRRVSKSVDLNVNASGNVVPNGDDKVSSLESRIENLEFHMNEVKEMLAEVLARLQ
jgi:hypothetical protein